MTNTQTQPNLDTRRTSIKIGQHSNDSLLIDVPQWIAEKVLPTGYYGSPAGGGSATIETYRLGGQKIERLDVVLGLCRDEWTDEAREIWHYYSINADEVCPAENPWALVFTGEALIATKLVQRRPSV